MINITDFRNPKYTTEDNSIIGLEVYEETMGWIPVSIMLTMEQPEHMLPVKNWLTENIASVAAYYVDTALVKQELKELVASVRYEKETGGMVFNGIPIDTTENSQAKITGAALQATIDNTVILYWKTVNGPVPLDAASVIAVAQAVRVHIQDCFNREFEIIAAIDNDTYDASMLTTGWPTYA